MSVQLIGTDDIDSILLVQHEEEDIEEINYSPYGNNNQANAALPFVAFTGQRPDPINGDYHLGNGYRTYSPTLMRFTSPDSWSPFGAGGINPYTYCEGDPINKSDPSGHVDAGGIVGIILGGLAIIEMTDRVQTSISAEGGLKAAWHNLSATHRVFGGVELGTSVLADVIGIASYATEDSDPEKSDKLAWASLAIGIVAFATGMVLRGHERREHRRQRRRREVISMSETDQSYISGPDESAQSIEPDDADAAADPQREHHQGENNNDQPKGSETSSSLNTDSGEGHLQSGDELVRHYMKNPQSSITENQAMHIVEHFRGQGHFTSGACQMQVSALKKRWGSISGRIAAFDDPVRTSIYRAFDQMTRSACEGNIMDTTDFSNSPFFRN